MDENIQGYWDSIVDALDPVEYGDALEAIRGIITKPTDTTELDALRAENNRLMTEIRTRWKNLTEGDNNEVVTDYTKTETPSVPDLDLSELARDFDGSTEA